MFKKEGLKSFLLGVLTYFLVSVILEIINLDSILIELLVLLGVILVGVILHYFRKK